MKETRSQSLIVTSSGTEETTGDTIMPLLDMKPQKAKNSWTAEKASAIVRKKSSIMGRLQSQQSHFAEIPKSYSSSTLVSGGSSRDQLGGDAAANLYSNTPTRGHTNLKEGSEGTGGTHNQQESFPKGRRKSSAIPPDPRIYDNVSILYIGRSV